MKTVHREYRVAKERIGFIRFIFEAYEGVAVVTTLDAQSGHIRLMIAPQRIETAKAVIDALKKEFLFDEL